LTVLAVGATLSLAATAAAVSPVDPTTLGPIARAAKSDQKKASSSKKSSSKQRKGDDASSKGVPWGPPDGKAKYKKQGPYGAAGIRNTVGR
jgi:hypothetical protein